MEIEDRGSFFTGLIRIYTFNDVLKWGTALVEPKESACEDQRHYRN